MSFRPHIETVGLVLVCVFANSPVRCQQISSENAPGAHEAQARAAVDPVAQPGDVPLRPAAASSGSVAAAPPDLSKDIDSLPASEALGDSLLARGRYLAAMRVFDRVVPRSAVIANKAGVGSEHMLMFDKAKLNFEEALRLDPKYAEAVNNLATVYHSRGDLGRAEKLYKKAIQLKPGSADTWQNLGALYYSKRKFKKGDDAFREALRIDPGIVERTSSRGIRATGDKHNTAEVHYHLACTYAEAGRANLALDYLRRCIVEGFHDSNRMLHEKVLADLRTSPVFLQLVEDMKKN